MNKTIGILTQQSQSSLQGNGMAAISKRITKSEDKVRSVAMTNSGSLNY